jgi:hypothetical protein
MARYRGYTNQVDAYPESTRTKPSIPRDYAEALYEIEV